VNGRVDVPLSVRGELLLWFNPVQCYQTVHYLMDGPVRRLTECPVTALDSAAVYVCQLVRKDVGLKTRLED
jgi:hypothetical protein